ncbi:MAG: hypothetical protein IH983_14605 [Planctomycetes bacterium]|nr:hypothetical protein [Planctomycetota bacterium]
MTQHHEKDIADRSIERLPLKEAHGLARKYGVVAGVVAYRVAVIVLLLHLASLGNHIIKGGLYVKSDGRLFVQGKVTVENSIADPVRVQVVR